MRTFILLVIATCSILNNAVAQGAATPAFPGAEGNGSATPGGRGGAVYLVTTLEDAGPGSLRDACEAAEPRIVVLTVDGIIELESPIDINDPFITIAGQTAPGGGVCLKNFGINITTDDVVIRYLRIRPGNETESNAPGIAITNGERIIVDHCSISWTTGPAIAVSGDSDEITLQWNLIAESLFDDEDDSGKSGMGVSLASDAATFSIHHNYFAHNNTGNPYLNGAAEAPGPLLDFRNNIVYDWGVRAGDSANNIARYNIVGNAYKAGPSTLYDVRAKAFNFRSLEARIYGLRNALAGSDMVTGSNFFLWKMPEEYILRVHLGVFQNEPYEAPSTINLPQETLLRRVLAESGATSPRRDYADARVIAQYRLSGGRLIGSPNEVEGWPAYNIGDAPIDTDHDGMPDEWEGIYGLSKTDPNDSTGDPDNDGYTNIEEYLNSTAPAAPVKH